MSRLLTAVTISLLAMLAGCTSMSYQQVDAFRAEPHYTCCNMHYESDRISDANYQKGMLIPLGTPVEVISIKKRKATLSINGARYYLFQDYGTDEPLAQYLSKILPTEDPRPQLAALPRAVQDAIYRGMVEKGMTRDEVLLSLGYPPTHRTPSVDLPEWVYWQSRFATFRVQYSPEGYVWGVVGRNVPSRDQPVRALR